jgi:hypothetical protein
LQPENAIIVRHISAGVRSGNLYSHLFRRNIMKTILFFLLLVLIYHSGYCEITPKYHPIGKSKSPIDLSKVQVLLTLPVDNMKYELLGSIDDCTFFPAKVEEFILAFKAIAARNGANAIVLKRTDDDITSNVNGNTVVSTISNSISDGSCYEAQAIYLFPPKASENSEQSGNESCISYMKQVIKLHQTIDSLRAQVDSLKTITSSFSKKSRL